VLEEYVMNRSWLTEELKEKISFGAMAAVIGIIVTLLANSHV
jgi:hypothetical protein